MWLKHVMSAQAVRCDGGIGLEAPAILEQLHRIPLREASVRRFDSADSSADNPI